MSSKIPEHLEERQKKHFWLQTQGFTRPKQPRPRGLAPRKKKKITSSSKPLGLKASKKQASRTDFQEKVYSKTRKFSIEVLKVFAQFFRGQCQVKSLLWAKQKRPKYSIFTNLVTQAGTVAEKCDFR